MSISLESERCPSCGRENSVHLETCHNCGKPLPWGPDASATASPGAPGTTATAAPLDRKEVLLTTIAVVDFSFGLFLWCGNYFGFLAAPVFASYMMMILGGGFYIFKERALEERENRKKGNNRRR